MERNFTHSAPNHIKIAASALVEKTPIVSIDGRIPAVMSESRTPRNALPDTISLFANAFLIAQTYLLAAITSALRECTTSTQYAAEGLNTKSTFADNTPINAQ